MQRDNSRLSDDPDLFQVHPHSLGRYIGQALHGPVAAVMDGTWIEFQNTPTEAIDKQSKQCSRPVEAVRPGNIHAQQECTMRGAIYHGAADSYY